MNEWMNEWMLNEWEQVILNKTITIEYQKTKEQQKLNWVERGISSVIVFYCLKQFFLYIFLQTHALRMPNLTFFTNICCYWVK